ncbi:MAG: hypothetical protein BYD32DRAFT_419068 [Podila humilis]|nr:MAG: hypothetical protein BYD32DRAFT_419068 [Podila humilis]
MGERLVVEHARSDRRRDDGGRRDRDDRFRPPERTEYRLIVENLAHGVSWQDIKDLMRKAGEVTFADINKDQDNQGVVEFSSADDVQNALKTLNGENLRGNPVSLREFDPSRDSAPRDMGRNGGRDRGGRDGRDRRDRDRRDYGRSDDRDRRDRDRRDRDRRRSRSRSRGGRRSSRDRGGRSRSRDRRSRSRDRGGRSDRSGRRSRSPAPRERSPIRERSPVRERTPVRERSPVRGSPVRGSPIRERSPIRTRSPARERSSSPAPRRNRSRSASRD